MIPSKHILTNYARVLVDFALGGGRGIKPKDVVLLQYDEPAKPLAMQVYQRILERGGHAIVKSASEAFSKLFYHKASYDQLTFFPSNYLKGLVKTIDHRIYLIAQKDPLYLRFVKPEKIMTHQKSYRDYRTWMEKKEDEGRLTWTLALYGTSGMSQEANLSIDEYWGQIMQGCFLDAQDPIAKWRSVYTQIEQIKQKLNKLRIKKVRIKSFKTDLTLTIGERRKWIGGGGCNIPSFEIFTSPDWRGTEGHIYFDLPLYRHGHIMRGIYLEFRKGRVIKASAECGEELLSEMIKTKGADRVGEFSLTDSRHSHITKFMAETLYDENFGGTHGNTHIALGASYHDTYNGEAHHVARSSWSKMGFNASVEHCDIIATHDRVIEAELESKVKTIIYQKGRFTI